MDSRTPDPLGLSRRRYAVVSVGIGKSNPTDDVPNICHERSNATVRGGEPSSSTRRPYGPKRMAGSRPDLGIITDFGLFASPGTNALVRRRETTPNCPS